MIYRIRLKVGYYENWFEFSDITEASEFAKTILEHQVISEDLKERRLSITLEIANKEEE